MTTILQLQALAREIAREYGIPARGFVAQIGKESSWNPNAVSPDGAMGLAQIMPATIPDTGIEGDPFDPETSLRMGASYMLWCRAWLAANGLPSSWPYVLGAYHSGIGNVRAAVIAHGDGWINGLGPAGQGYVRSLSLFYGAPAVNPVLLGLAVLALALLVLS